jgi:hypothetical protein
MFIAIAVTLLCAVLLIVALLREACRHRPDWRMTSDDAILCGVSPFVIMLGTFGGAALGYRLVHGGLAAVSVTAWISSAAIVAAAIAIWVTSAAAIRKSGRARAGAPIAA